MWNFSLMTSIFRWISAIFFSLGSKCKVIDNKPDNIVRLCTNCWIWCFFFIWMGETGTSTPPSCVYRFTKRQTHRGYISRGFWQLTPSFRSAECVEAVCVLLFSSWLFWMADRDIPHIFFGIGGQTRNYVMRQNDPNWKQINIHAVSVSVCFVRRAAFGGWFVFVLVFILPIMNRVGAFSRITFFSLCARQVLRSINKYRTHATARFIDKFCAHCNLRVFGHMTIQSMLKFLTAFTHVM